MSKDVVVVDGCNEERGTVEEKEIKRGKQKVRRINRCEKTAAASAGARAGNKVMIGQASRYLGHRQTPLVFGM